nr:PucR family transcriptional regulator ligand-binding domain-containing protein [Paenibacillus xylanexedens]
MLTDLLKNGIYDDARVITGHKGLIREVQTVNIMDCPDIIRFLRPNELLLTNGFFMKQQPEMFIHLIRDMQRLHCSGLAIKTKRFELPIPDEILWEADQNEFPIIEISDVRLSLGEILQRSTSVILNNKSDELQYALSIHKKILRDDHARQRNFQHYRFPVQTVLIPSHPVKLQMANHLRFQPRYKCC